MNESTPYRLPLLLLAIALSACGRGGELGQEERVYLQRVEAVVLPLRLAPEDRDSVMARAIDWIDRYSVYRIRTRSSDLVMTDMPGSAVEGGVGYRISAAELDERLTVEIEVLRADRYGGRSLVPDPVIERMLGLYLSEGILPPNDRVGFEETRR